MAPFPCECPKGLGRTDAPEDPRRTNHLVSFFTLSQDRSGSASNDLPKGYFSTEPRDDMGGTVDQLFVAAAGSEPMERVETVEAVEGGLRGDRYRRGTGHYSPFDVCEVTLVEAEALDEIHDEFGIDLFDGGHRRNVVVRDVDVHGLLGTTFRIGDALLRGTRPRPPCAHVEQLARETGVARALKEGRGGVCADVVGPGSIAVGDEVEIVEDDSRTAGQRIADRLGLGRSIRSKG